MTVLSLDIESGSELYFGKGPRNVGLDRYSKHESTCIFMCGFGFNDDPVDLWDCTAQKRFPSHLLDALHDPTVEIHAFNAQFERVMFREVWGIDIPYERWRCTLALSYMLSFIGGLDEVGECIGLPEHMKKDKRGEDLIRLFSSPQRITKNQPFAWRDSLTDPEAWEQFKEYCKRDVVAEREIWRRLSKYPIEGWAAYHLDQKMNDRGLPVDRQFLVNASTMAARRKEELTEQMKALTGLANPNSSPQLTSWLVERGYPFKDIGKDTVKKVLAENAAGMNKVALPGEVVSALKLRQQVARTSVKKFDAVLYRLPPGDDVVRYAFQFAGASRTNRWASRGGVQLHNMPRTPGFLETVEVLEEVSDLIRDGDYDGLREFCEWCVGKVDILDALVGCVRSMLRAGEDEEFVVSDLSSIETVGIGLLSSCERILNVFREGKDAYKDFGTVMFAKDYDQVTKKERSLCKPPVLACGFGIAGGELEDGKKTGLWLYAENMSIPMSREEAHAAVDAYHRAYPEVRPFSWALKDAMAQCINTGNPVRCGLVTFRLMKPFVLMVLPSGRPIYYHLPRVHYERRISQRTGNEYTATVITVMGKSEAGNKWVRRPLSPGLLVENADQAMCRDILVAGKLAADADGFDIRGSVHDELITLHPKGDNYYTPERLGANMTAALPWLPNAPLGFGAFASQRYRKD